ncbi:MAG: allantoate amidohydrolase [Bryobacteraceae bacterium]
MSCSAAEEVIARCLAIAQCTETPGSITRTFLCDAMHDCHRLVRGWMEAAGLGVRVDAMGNLRGVYPGTDGQRRRLIIGSHLDTVPNAGAYDGVLGVVLGISLVEGLQRRPMPFDIEVIGFSEEEGVRFGTPFLGSRALVGRAGDTLALRDSEGITVDAALRAFGLDPAGICEAAVEPDAVIGYLEFHIEQGPVLESVEQPLAVVEAIAGQSRRRLRFIGKANHAGTTPMHLRRDALTGAAEWISFVERYAKATAGLVATVGHIDAKPSAGNVIPGEVNASLDVRHANDDVRSAAVQLMLAKAEEIAQARGLQVQCEVLLEQSAVAMDSGLVAVAEQALKSCGVTALRMTSGAGHDAMIMAEKVPTVMMFLRSPGGISHHPDEAVLVEDVELALRVGERFLEEVADSERA